MNTFTRGVRSTFRNGIRTGAIVVILGLSVGLSLSMWIARDAVQAKIASVKSSIGNTITISPAGARGFDGGGDPLTNDSIAKVKATPHITSVSTSLGDRLASTDTSLQSAIDAGSLGTRFRQFGSPSGGSDRPAGKFTPPIRVTGTTDPSNTSTFGGGKLNITSGQTIDGNKDDTVALIGNAVATKNNLTVGSTFQAYNTTFKVAGVFDAGNQFAGSGIIVPLPTLQRLSNQPGAITSATAQVDSITNVDSTTTALKSALGTTADVTSQQDSSNQALAPLENISSISTFNVIGALGAGAVIILLTMIMIVRERRREIGVLKAIGSSNLRVMAQFMAEATTFTMAGSILGLVIGIASAAPLTKLLVTSNTVQPAANMGRGFVRAFANNGLRLDSVNTTISWIVIVYGLAAMILIALVGSAVAAFMIAKIRPAEVMRTE
ncbi:MAG TPA: FtsX-like permease family protein [Patescibacteria group bacterium]|jgi:putative ABC transport system permease protein|nr:FtsX-like permease family protein [Patescibacteria group bacterium]